MIFLEEAGIDMTGQSLRANLAAASKRGSIEKRIHPHTMLCESIKCRNRFFMFEYKGKVRTPKALPSLFNLQGITNETPSS